MSTLDDLILVLGKANSQHANDLEINLDMAICHTQEPIRDLLNIRLSNSIIVR
jgi:hypothetical protein